MSPVVYLEPSRRLFLELWRQAKRLKFSQSKTQSSVQKTGEIINYENSLPNR
jgi:hypothetical protein